jgi:hypothetical protein
VREEKYIVGFREAWTRVHLDSRTRVPRELYLDPDSRRGIDRSQIRRDL